MGALSGGQLATRPHPGRGCTAGPTQVAEPGPGVGVGSALSATLCLGALLLGIWDPGRRACPESPREKPCLVRVSKGTVQMAEICQGSQLESEVQWTAPHGEGSSKGLGSKGAHLHSQRPFLLELRGPGPRLTGTCMVQLVEPLPVKGHRAQMVAERLTARRVGCDTLLSRPEVLRLVSAVSVRKCGGTTMRVPGTRAPGLCPWVLTSLCLSRPTGTSATRTDQTHSECAAKIWRARGGGASSCPHLQAGLGDQSRRDARSPIWLVDAHLHKGDGRELRGCPQSCSWGLMANSKTSQARVQATLASSEQWGWSEGLASHPVVNRMPAVLAPLCLQPLYQGGAGWSLGWGGARAAWAPEL